MATGANIASAIPNVPKRNGPLDAFAPRRARQSLHSVTMRAMSSSTAGVVGSFASFRRTFMGIAVRRAAKLECISALTARAMARDARSAGHIFASGKSSARYSPMADDSHTTSSPCFNAGTRPDGENGRIAVVRRPAPSSGMTTSSNAAPVCFIMSHARRDHDE